MFMKTCPFKSSVNTLLDILKQKILILTIATNKYIQFVERLYDNIEDKFLNGHEIQGLLFTEHDVETSDNIKVSQIEHEPWPMPTLKRYNYFIKEKEFISQFDYCYYFDVEST